MPRRPRPQFEDAIYHVTTRGVLRGRVFVDVADRPTFLDLLATTVERFRWRCHAYCLMGNHYHLLIETPEPNVARGMELLNGLYARGFNWRHGRRGHVFEARYGARLVERQRQFLTTARYIVLNPVRAAICRSADGWPWSSFGATAGHSAVPGWLDAARVLGEFDVDSRLARGRYAAFVAAGAAELLSERRAHERAARLMSNPASAG